MPPCPRCNSETMLNIIGSIIPCHYCNYSDTTGGKNCNDLRCNIYICRRCVINLCKI